MLSDYLLVRLLIIIGIIAYGIQLKTIYKKKKSFTKEKQEKYQSLDSKKLDDEQYWENDLIYDDEFRKKDSNDTRRKKTKTNKKRKI